MKGVQLEDIMQELATEQNQQWFAWAIAGMVMADKKMTKSEEKYIRELFTKHCREETVAAITMFMKHNTKIELDPLRLEKRSVATKMIKYLVTIAATDKEIAQSERDYLQYIGKKLGFLARTIQNVIAWRKREMLRQEESVRDENEVTLHLRSETPHYE